MGDDRQVVLPGQEKPLEAPPSTSTNRYPTGQRGDLDYLAPEGKHLGIGGEVATALPTYSESASGGSFILAAATATTTASVRVNPG